jgi:transposase
MKETQLREEIFKMRFTTIYDRFNKGKLTCEAAAEMLGVSIKTFYRKRQRYDDEDFDGRFDRRLGKESPHRAADREVEMITRLYNERYKGFSVKHFYEFAQREHGLSRSYNWTRMKLTEKGLVEKSTRGGKHRLRRERKAMAGMMIHQDGSKHRWIPALDCDLDLIVTMDDATSEILSAFLVEEEGTLSTFQGLQETIERKGLFCTFYTDRGSHYFYTEKAGGKVSKTQLTQVGRALRQLSIKHIAAYSPEARGRSERMFGTLQKRLPKELVLHNITTIKEANRYIQDTYLPRHNGQFAVKPKCEESAFMEWKSNRSLKDILCIQEERMVQKDNTIRYDGFILQIPKNKYRSQYTKAEVEVHKYADGKMSVFYGNFCIGQYDEEGNLIKQEEIAA